MRFGGSGRCFEHFGVVAVATYSRNLVAWGVLVRRNALLSILVSRRWLRSLAMWWPGLDRSVHPPTHTPRKIKSSLLRHASDGFADAFPLDASFLFSGLFCYVLAGCYALPRAIRCHLSQGPNPGGNPASKRERHRNEIPGTGRRLRQRYLCLSARARPELPLPARFFTLLLSSICASA